MTRMITYRDALREAIEIELERDPTVFLAGEDVGQMGGIYFVTKWIVKKFGPERIIDTPISETAIIGLGVGAALAGMRPIVEISFMDFIGICLDEIGNQAAKMRYMFGGKAKVPLVIRTSSGAGLRIAAQHSQSLEAWVAHVPGLKVVLPTTPANAKGLLISAIRDDNPVIFIEGKALYNIKGEVPEGEYTLPIGKADVVMEGKDITIVSWSRTVHTCLEAAAKLEGENIDCEVIDLLSLVPLDKNLIISSVRKTGRLVIVHEAVGTGGFGGEIAAIAADQAFDSLKGPIKRVTAPDTPIPYAGVLEDEYIPSSEKILNLVKEFIKK
jgi:acetoin:2,6-dichlorophenolindophenol oxidoreductase subunit beta